MGNDEADLQFVVVDGSKRRCFLVFGDFAFEEVLFLAEVHHFGKPREWILDARIERVEPDSFKTAIGDEVDVGAEFICIESN